MPAARRPQLALPAPQLLDACALPCSGSGAAAAHPGQGLGTFSLFAASPASPTQRLRAAAKGQPQVQRPLSGATRLHVRTGPHGCHRLPRWQGRAACAAAVSPGAGQGFCVSRRKPPHHTSCLARKRATHWRPCWEGCSPRHASRKSSSWRLRVCILCRYCVSGDPQSVGSRSRSWCRGDSCASRHEVGRLTWGRSGVRADQASPACVMFRRSLPSRMTHCRAHWHEWLGQSDHCWTARSGCPGMLATNQSLPSLQTVAASTQAHSSVRGAQEWLGCHNVRHRAGVQGIQLDQTKGSAASCAGIQGVSHGRHW